MAIGPVEIVVIGFRQGKFEGAILPEIQKLVEAGTIAIIDGLVVHKPAEDEIVIVELSEDHEDADVASLASLATQIDGIISESDVEILIDALPVGSAAAVLAFEHTWVKPLRDSILAAGGELVDSIRIPGLVVQEVLDAVAALEK